MIGRTKKRIAIVCHDLVCAGGLLRFERFARVAASRGCGISYIRCSKKPNPEWKSRFEVVELENSGDRQWDLTVVPGSGFHEETINKLKCFRDDRFGIRMQHILNDQSRRETFLHVNRMFQPQILVFNNRHWPPGSFTDFMADRFHFLEGAVDCIHFAPQRHKTSDQGDRLRIGGLANKNPAPLIEAIRLLPDHYELRLYGKVGALETTAADLIASGRLKLFGVLDDEQLADFYADLDCVVHTERSSGWANLAAEALACRVPLICTPHGTLAFAKHLETAIVIPEPEPGAIKSAIERITDDQALAYRLSRKGRETITRFSWGKYADALLEIADSGRDSHYLFAPELGLHGKWPPETRLLGLDGLLESCAGKTVLDLGCAEGIVSLQCLKHDAALVHGFDIDAWRSSKAAELCSGFRDARFRQADLCPWSAFKARHADLLGRRYDIVLYLGVHHHLPATERRTVLLEACRLAGEFFAIRTTEPIYQKDGILELLAEEGLYPLQFAARPAEQESHGRLVVLSR